MFHFCNTAINPHQNHGHSVNTKKALYGLAASLILIYLRITFVSAFKKGTIWSGSVISSNLYTKSACQAIAVNGDHYRSMISNYYCIDWKIGIRMTCGFSRTLLCNRTHSMLDTRAFWEPGYFTWGCCELVQVILLLWLIRSYTYEVSFMISYQQKFWCHLHDDVFIKRLAKPRTQIPKLLLLDYKL